jgi:hypothetical protein
MAHTERAELLQKLEEAAKSVEVGGHYTHYRAPQDVYRVTGFGIDEDTEQVRVEYQRINENPPIPWRRVLNGDDGWLTTVQDDEGQKIPRFRKVD